ncbi:hypothetical protein RHIZO_04350 [Rhizobiaceae bacterium]|nr:hypothetical protein RHIZO_04350 [Rhizobiaceae bacterium]
MQNAPKTSSRISSTSILPVTRPSSVAATRNSSATNSRSRPAASPRRSASQHLLIASRCLAFCGPLSSLRPTAASARHRIISTSASRPSPVTVETASASWSPAPTPFRSAFDRMTIASGHRGAERTASASAGRSSTTRSAESARATAFPIPICSTRPAVSRSPAVSVTTTFNPPRSSGTSTRSRVVPGSSVTIATSRPTKAFRRLDFPAFGGPTITT